MGEPRRPGRRDLGVAGPGTEVTGGDRPERVAAVDDDLARPVAAIGRPPRRPGSGWGRTRGAVGVKPGPGGAGAARAVGVKPGAAAGRSGRTAVGTKPGSATDAAAVEGRGLATAWVGPPATPTPTPRTNAAIRRARAGVSRSAPPARGARSVRARARGPRARCPARATPRWRARARPRPGRGARLARPGRTRSRSPAPRARPERGSTGKCHPRRGTPRHGQEAQTLAPTDAWRMAALVSFDAVCMRLTLFDAA